jgi:hypothetical protein
MRYKNEPDFNLLGLSVLLAERAVPLGELYNTLFYSFLWLQR